MPVFINNVDDYLGPSQACVNPLFAPPPKKPPPSSSSDVHHLNDNDGSKISNGAKATTTTTNTNNNINPTPRRVVQNRRIRRRAPRIIKCEEGSDDTPNTNKSKQPIRLLAADEKEVNGNEIIHDNTPPVINTATTQTTTHTIKKKKATVTLSDCLSCSGCVTSAEAVLMSHHSIDTLREIASPSQHSQHQQQLKKKRIAFTISSASLADLYRHLYLENDLDDDESSASTTSITKDTNKSSSLLPSRNEFLTNISSFLQTEFNAIMIMDGAVTQHVSLIESAFEFCYRYRKNNTSHEDEQDDGMEVETTNESTCNSVPSVAISSTRTRYINKQPDNSGNSDNVTMDDDDTLMEITTLNHPPGRINEGDLVNNNNNNNKPSTTSTSSPLIQQSNSLPLLTSSCPGFVCLVEKTTPSIVPLLSSAKSPMSIAGVLIKTSSSSSSQCSMKNDDLNYLSMVVGKDDDNDDYYHVAIMPCHDKKLEAGRGDFAWEKQVLLRYGNNDGATTVAQTKTSGAPNVNDGEGTEEEKDLVNEVDLVLTTGELLEILSDAVTKQQKKKMNGDASTLIPQLPKNQSMDDETASPSVNEIRNLLARNNAMHDSCTLMTTDNDNLLLNEKMNDVELDTGVHGSGSYADFIFRYASYEIFGYKLPHDEPLPWKSSSSTYTATSSTAAGKNNNTTTTGVIRRRRRRQETTDLREVTLYKHNDGSYSCYNDKTMDGSDGTNHSKPVLRFATAYGFKNVQLILQSLSSNKTTTPSYSTSLLSTTTTGYDYVEVMACPSGCSNGGGQIGSYGKRETPRETKERVRKTVSAVPLVRPVIRSGQCTSSSLATTLCDDCSNNKRGNLIINDAILESESFGKNARELFHTRFHVVPKLELSTGATAGVAVNDTKW